MLDRLGLVREQPLGAWQNQPFETAARALQQVVVRETTSASMRRALRVSLLRGTAACARSRSSIASSRLPVHQAASASPRGPPPRGSSSLAGFEQVVVRLAPGAALDGLAAGAKRVVDDLAHDELSRILRAVQSGDGPALPPRGRRGALAAHVGGGRPLQRRPRPGAAERFVDAHPPPNVTGELHMGHALQLALGDARLSA